MLESLQPDHAVNSMLACKALSNLVAAGHPLSVEKVDTSSLSSLLTSPSTTHCKRHQKVLSLLPALLPAASNNLETALASLLSNLSVISLFRVSCWWQKDCRALHGYNQCEIWLMIGTIPSQSSKALEKRHFHFLIRCILLRPSE